MPVPSATYRIQLHNDFTLRDLQRIIEYLHTLGIDTIYASPLMQAAPGSMHGYDVTDPHTVNSEIGDVEDFRSIIHELRKKNMLWLQDIVPNHMAFHTANFRLMDVLERGPDSPYYRYFDIDWEHPDEDLKGKVMVPFLGEAVDVCLTQSQLKLILTTDGLKVSYFDTAYPLSIPAYDLVASAITRYSGTNDTAGVVLNLAAASKGRDCDTWRQAKVELFSSADAELSGIIAGALEQINQNKEQLSEVLEHQYFRLCHWKETDRRINYRRFFTVNELICLRMENEDVFEEYHKVLFSLFREKLIDGFRIDHIDGLLDPAKYTEALRSHTSHTAYLIAEKILEAKEGMPGEWPLEGTSGYEFLSLINRLLTNRAGARQLVDFYRELVPGLPEYRRLIFNSKRSILENYMSGEWDNLVRLFYGLGFGDNRPDTRMRSALGLFMLCLPVYRIYPDSLPLKGRSLAIIHETFDRALKADGEFAEELSYLRTLFTNPMPGDDGDRLLTFMRRLMQFTGPLTAKGVEDTTFYIYNPLISHDEVGDSPAPLAMTVRRFHERMQMRQSSTPLSLNATATHDTKRGEDARARLNVLSRIPSVWMEHVRQWLAMNERFRVVREGKTVPEINDEYFIYQSILGGFPEDFKITEEWKKRVQAYINKALREGKVNTNWSEPDEDYEQACEAFIDKILDESHTFLPSFVPFVQMVCEHAMVYSLTQVLIKLTAPGIPDIYQGCELWNLSFVDPDNRRPVDYEKRMQFLFQLIVKEAQGPGAALAYLRENRGAGIEKLYIIRKVLNYRKGNPALFTGGEYIPVEITGQAVNAAAYARTDGDDWTLTIFPFGLVKHEDDRERVHDEYVVLPEAAPGRWHNLFTGEVFETPNQLLLSDVLRHFPVAFLVSIQAG